MSTSNDEEFHQCIHECYSKGSDENELTSNEAKISEDPDESKYDQPSHAQLTEFRNPVPCIERCTRTESSFGAVRECVSKCHKQGAKIVGRVNNALDEFSPFAIMMQLENALVIATNKEPRLSTKLTMHWTSL